MVRKSKTKSKKGGAKKKGCGCRKKMVGGFFGSNYSPLLPMPSIPGLGPIGPGMIFNNPIMKKIIPF